MNILSRQIVFLFDLFLATIYVLTFQGSVFEILTFTYYSELCLYMFVIFNSLYRLNCILLSQYQSFLKTYHHEMYIFEEKTSYQLSYPDHDLDEN